MKTSILIAGALAAAGLFAQGPEPHVMAFQQLGVAGGPGGGNVTIRAFGPDGPNGQTVAGKPLSATEERHTVQVLADGTHIENTDSNAFYRDEQGRTRSEFGPAGATRVMIHDPVAGYSVMLEPESKTAHKMPLPPGGNVTVSVAGAGISTEEVHTARVGGFASSTEGGNVVLHSKVDMSDAAKEDLGTQTINGVLAQGTRTTMTIPAGKIGNDRPIQVVNERWYSSELQMLVKSSNKDPRFGETTYELTNIDRSAPAAALFQVPSDYTVQDGHGQWFTTTTGAAKQE
jgi:hypothetical protein